MRAIARCGWFTVFVVALSSATAQAGTINVAAGDAAALVAAINTANGNGEADTLNVSGTYSFSAANNFWYGPNALPAITSDIAIVGSATSGAVITSTNATRLRLFYVSGARSGLTAGTLRLRVLEVRNGIARGGGSSFGGGGAGLGGAIYNQGTLQADRVTLTGNQALGGNAQYIGAAVDGGGGMGENASTTQAGGFGGAMPGVDAGTGGTGGAAGQGGGGGGGGYGATDDGANGASPTGGVGGGAQNGLGGANAKGVRGGNGSGAGGTASNVFGATPVGAAGGAFGAGGFDGGENTPMSGGGGGGVGGGGGSSNYGAGSGGFGGGGAWSTYDPGNGGFGAGGGGVDNRNPVLPAIGGKGGYGGGDAANPAAGTVTSGGGGAGMGGAIFNDRGTVTLTNSTLTANIARGGVSQGVGQGVGFSSEGGDGRGAALCSLDGTALLTHVTIAGNTAQGGIGAINGVAGGTICTIGYDSAVPGTATLTIRQSIVTESGGGATSEVAPATLADGSTNRFTASTAIEQTTYVGGADPQLAPLGDYGGPTRTMAPAVGSPVIDAATVQERTPIDQRGFTRPMPSDVGAVETILGTTGQITTSPTIPFSASNRNVTLTATVLPARGTSSPGTVSFSAAGIASSVSAAITGATATTTTFNVPGNTPPGSYALSAASSDAPGFLGRAAAPGAVLRILNAPQVCGAVSASTPFQTAVTVAPSCTGAGPATVALVGAPANGAATVVAGNLRYTPAPGFAGTDSFTYRTNNEGGDSNTATVTVTVRNAPRVCAAVTATTPNATPVTVAPSCTGSGGGTVEVVTVPAHGTATVVAGELRYTPAAGYAGVDSFTYRVTNDGGPSNTATVTVTVLNAPLVCSAVSASTPFETAVTVAPSCAGAGPGTLAVVGAPAHGTATVVAGELRYTPAAGYAGTDSFTYRVTNDGGPSNTATVTITVAHPAPTCTAAGGEAGAGRPRTLTLTCTSPIAQTFAIIDGPAHGTLTALDDTAGTVVYTATDDYAGPDSFRYRSTSTSGPSNDATFTLDVKPRATLTTTPSGDVVLGAPLSAQAKVSERFEPQPGSTITFLLYGPGCSGPPVFMSETTPADDGSAASGPFTPTTAGTYAWQVEYGGDANNLPVTGECAAVSVAAPATQPAPAPTPAPVAPAASCGDPVVLLDVAPTGARTRVTGIARPASAGQTVTILRGATAVGTATIGADGTFAATVAGRPRGAKGVLTYSVTLGSSRSQAFRYDRRLKIVRRSGLKITGNLAVEKPPKFVTVHRIDVCTKRRTATRAKVSKTGTFTFTMRPRDAATPYALYRVQAKIGRTSRSYSTQVAVTR